MKKKQFRTLFLGFIVSLVMFGLVIIYKEALVINSDPPGIGSIIKLVLHG